MSPEQLRNLPSTFYRVAVKCLIFNDAGELLVIKSDQDDYEIPGGGWEHGETIEECVQRELLEELGVRAKTISAPETVLQGKSDRGWYVLRVVVRVELESTDFSFGEDSIVDAQYVDQPTLADLHFCSPDEPFLAIADQIWSKH